MTSQKGRAGGNYAIAAAVGNTLPPLRGQPSSFYASFVKLSLAVGPFYTKAHAAQLASVPARNEFALTTIFSIHAIAKLDVICMAAHSLRKGPLHAIWIGGTFRATGAGIAMSGAVVGNRVDGEVIPPFTRGAL